MSAGGGRRRDTLLAAVGAVILLVGVLLVRGAGREAADGGDGAVFVIDYDEARDLTHGARAVAVDGFSVALDVSPRPTPALAPATFTARVTRDGAPAAVSAVELTFNMSMDMGRHVYALVPRGSAWLAEGVVLPPCRSGGRRWFARLRFTADGAAHRAVFLLDLGAPSEGSE